MHIDAVVSFAAVTLQVELAQLFFLVGNNVLVIKLALVALENTQNDK